MLDFNCPKCNVSDIVKRGKRHNISGIKQLYLCNKCRTTFVEPDGFEHMRFSKEDIVRAVHLRNEGLSLFKTKDHLWQHDGIKVTREAINQWTNKYSSFLKSSPVPLKTKAKRQTAL
jgi:transposase-like protein